MGGSLGQATRAASPAWPAADQLAVPDDDGATDTDPLPGRSSATGLLILVGRHGAGDDDDSVADLGLVHGSPGPARMMVYCTDSHVCCQTSRRRGLGGEGNMARKKVSRNAPCPCGSGKKYKQCCWGRGFDWEEDEGGNLYRATPISP